MTIIALLSIALGLSVVTRRSKRTRSTVAMDGSHYRYHPKLQHMISAWLAHYVPQTTVNNLTCSPSVLPLGSLNRDRAYRGIIVDHFKQYSLLRWRVSKHREVAALVRPSHRLELCNAIMVIHGYSTLLSA